jgi:methyl-accepting chemotaxis protein
LSRIADSVAAIDEMNTQVATAAEEQSHVAEEMHRSIVHIAELASKTRSSAEQNLDVVGRIANLVDILRERSSQFQTEDMGLELEIAKAAHLAWRGKLRAFLDGKGGLTKEQAVSHRHCVLGKWYYGEGAKNFGHLPTMKEVEGPHADLHALINLIVDLNDAGKRSDAERAFEEIGPLSERIVSLLDDIEKVISESVTVQE